VPVWRTARRQRIIIRPSSVGRSVVVVSLRWTTPGDTVDSTGRKSVARQIDTPSRPVQSVRNFLLLVRLSGARSLHRAGRPPPPPPRRIDLYQPPAPDDDYTENAVAAPPTRRQSNDLLLLAVMVIGRRHRIEFESCGRVRRRD